MRTRTLLRPSHASPFGPSFITDGEGEAEGGQGTQVVHTTVRGTWGFKKSPDLNAHPPFHFDWICRI